MEAVSIGVTGAIVGAAGTFLTAMGIKMVGFTGIGVASGSLAAGIQSLIGNVALGSLFAGLTSVGATGAILSAVPLSMVAGILADQDTIKALSDRVEELYNSKWFPKKWLE